MARKYDHEYKVQAVKLAKEIGGAKAAKDSAGICCRCVTNRLRPNMIEDASLLSLKYQFHQFSCNCIIFHPHNTVFNLFFTQQMDIAVPDNFLIYNCKIFA